MLCQGGAWAAMASKMVEAAELDVWTTSMMGISATASLFGLGAVQLFASSVVHSISVDADARLQRHIGECTGSAADGDGIARSLVDVNVYAHTLLGTRGKKNTFRLQSMSLVGETPRFVAIKANPEDKFNYLLDYKRGRFADDRVLSAETFLSSIRPGKVAATRGLGPIVTSTNASEIERDARAASVTSPSPPSPSPAPSGGVSTPHPRRSPSKRRQKKRKKGGRR